MKTYSRFLAVSFSVGALIVGCSAAAVDAGDLGGPDGADGADGGDLGSGDLGSADDGVEDLPAPENCADGILDPDEVCDDGNTKSGDGCFGNCLGIEPSFVCPTPGEACRPFARCGDGLVSFPEQCDGGGAGVTGCTATCKFAIGFKCDQDGDGKTVCEPTVCGDGKIEGAETCEDSNKLPFDGCSSDCIAEPDCSAGACTSACGDGIVLGEDCDDGNTLDGDGCSASCQVEAGYACTQAACAQDASGDCMLTIPAIFRDFAEAHSDFENTSCKGVDSVIPNLVATTLTGGKPVPTGSSGCTDNLEQWYVDVPSVNVTFVGAIDLFDNGVGGFVNRYGKNGEKWIAPATSYACTTAGGCPYDGNPLFFPIDGLPGVKDDGGDQAAIGENYGINWLTESAISGHTNTGPHNFYFTSEVTYWFQFDASKSAKLDFVGDDDVWVFVNNTLAVDLGGLHSAKPGSITLSSANASTYGLEDGKVYAIKVFQAERMQDGSTFKLTLSGFESSRSDCTAVCGDGIVGFGEECDDGKNDGGYNECQAGCKLGGYCGDGIVQEGEACDDADPNAPADCSGCRLVVVR